MAVAGPGSKSRYPTVWARDAARAAERRRAAEPSPPNREQIVRAALEILDADGLDALSMRRLGTRLGMGATSLYWHVANKSELLDLAVDEVFGEIELPPEGHWQLAAGVFAHSMRQALLRHPWAARLFGSRPALGPNALALAERLMVLFENAGFDVADADRAVTTLMAYVLGGTSPEAAYRETLASSGLSTKEWLEQQRPAIEFGTRNLPRLREAYRQMDTRADLRMMYAVQFDFGLKVVLDGLATRLAAHSPVDEHS